MTYLDEYNSPLGTITLASNGESLTGLWFDGQKYFGADLLKESSRACLPVFESAKRWLDVYFSGREPDAAPPLSLDGMTPFQKTVCQMLLRIPYGKTSTYAQTGAQIERETGRRCSSRAVGGAVGHNRISIIIPCHRVLGAGGNLTGYAGGIARKDALLRLEGIDTARLIFPSRGTAL